MRVEQKEQSVGQAAARNRALRLSVNLLAFSLLSAPVQAFDSAKGHQSLDALKVQLEALKNRLAALEVAAQAAQSAPPQITKAEPAMALLTDDGLFEMNLRGRIYTDYVRTRDHEGTLDGTASELRAARIGVQGTAWKNIGYKFEVAFDGKETDIKVAQIDLATQAGVFTVGHINVPNSLEDLTSSRFNAFMERAAFTSAFSLDRKMGMQWSKGTPNSSLRIGYFKGDSLSQGFGEHIWAARATYGGTQGDFRWMIGGSLRDRAIGEPQQYRARPFVHTVDRVIDTGNVGSGDDFLTGMEAALVVGPLYSAAEYSALKVSDVQTQTGLRQAWMRGGYIDIGYFLTGEARPLDLKKGMWARQKIGQSVAEGGIGAWSVNARYDRVDLTGGGVYGGQQRSWILGINWWLNRHSRLLMNVAFTDIDRAIVSRATALDGSNSLKSLGFRMQFDW